MAKITDRGMQAKPTTRDQWLSENFGRARGTFQGRIAPNGIRTFYFRYTGSDGQERILIGPYDSKGDGKNSFTTSQAREKAQSFSTLYREGKIDLKNHLEIQAREQEEIISAELRRQQAEHERYQQSLQEAEEARQRRITVRKLFDEWRRADLVPQLRADGKRTGRKDGGKFVAEQFERHVFPHIGNNAVEDLKKSDILGIIDRQKAESKLRTAGVLFADLKQMLDFAANRDLIAHNPLSSLKKGKVVGSTGKRQRNLSDEEIQMLADQTPLAGLHPRTEAGIWLVMATGVRRGELIGAVWADLLPTNRSSREAMLADLRAKAAKMQVMLGIVDLRKRSWYLETTKNQRDHEIYLSDFAIKQFMKLRDMREGLIDDPQTYSPWVFPGTNNRLPLSAASFAKQISDRQRSMQQLSGRTKQTESLKLPGGTWRPHDLRRTCASTMARLRISEEVIHECTNHIQSDPMSQTYIRDRRIEEQKEAFTKLGEHLEKLCRTIDGPNEYA